MGRKLFIVVAAFVLLGGISACTTINVITYSLMELFGSIMASDTEDVTALETFRGEDIWKSYRRDGIYQLKRSLLYGKVFYSIRDEYELFSPWAEPGAPKASRYAEWNAKKREAVDLIPETIKAFTDDPAKWDRIKGVIPKGTKLKMARVIFEQTFDAHYFWYIAVFVDGPFADKPVLLNRLSKDGHSTAQSYNSDYLEQAIAP